VSLQGQLTRGSCARSINRRRQQVEEAMFRNLLIGIAALALANVAMADCDASHAAKHAVPDDQAQSTQPATKTAAAPAAKKKQLARESSDKSKQTAASTLALARDNAPPPDKPAN